MRSHILGCTELDLGNGFCKNIPLYHASGGSGDSGGSGGRPYRDLHAGPARPTRRIEHVPYLNETASTVYDVERLQMARARNPKNAAVVPHHDSVELDRELDRYFRTHVMSAHGKSVSVSR